MGNNTESRALAIVGNESITIPTDVAPILGKNNALIKAKNFIALEGGLTVEAVKGMKLSEVKEKVGKDKAKLSLAKYNTHKAAFHVWSSKVNALAAADPSLRKSVKVVVGTKGNVIGIDTKARFMADTAETSALVSLVAELRAELAAARALPAKA